jgi:hypothetical protein
LAILSLALNGCVVLEGAGSYSIGYRSTSEVFVGHTVDGDKDGKKASSRMDLSQLIDLLDDSPSPPSTGE